MGLMGGRGDDGSHVGGRTVATAAVAMGATVTMDVAIMAVTAAKPLMAVIPSMVVKDSNTV